MKNILLMEDDFTFGFLTATRLRDEGYGVDVASNASQAKDMLRDGSYDLLITDIIVREAGRPTPDGGMLLIGWMRSPLQRDQAIRKMPIIAISGTTKHPGMENILTSAEGLGASASLIKPFEFEELLEKVEELGAA